MGLLDIVGGMLGGQPVQPVQPGQAGQPGQPGQGGPGGLGALGDLLGQMSQMGQMGQMGQPGPGAQAAQGGGPAVLLQLVLGLLANDGQGGGLGGLLQKFQAAGLGEQMNSWVGGGQNLPVSPEQLHAVFGSEQMAQMAERMGLSTGDLGTQLSQLLPQAVDQFTPGGQAPEGGLGELGELLGQLMRR